jgi:ABC-2 type transport system ATP-binding protein
MNVIELSGVRKVYDLQIAVNDISFAVSQGSIFGLLGPNGAGKTSTIRMITGITYPDQGEIRLFNEPQRPEHQDRVGYMPEERGLYKKLTVRHQLEYLGALKGLDKHRLKNSIDMWLERLELATSQKKKTNELSKGMHQKLQFIATVLHDPDLLINDILIEMRKSGKTIVLSTHRMEQVEQLCDEIVLMNRGSIVLEGTLRELKQRSSRKLVNVAFYGDDSFTLALPSNVTLLSHTPNESLLEFTGTSKPSDLLTLIASKTEVRKWELIEPPLKELFLEAVAKKGQTVTKEGVA